MKKDNVTSEVSAARYICELLEIVIIAFALSWGIRTFFLETYLVPNDSMSPTYEINEHLLIDKSFYKSFPLINNSDIIVYGAPQNINSKEKYMNRVIAMPGDTIEIRKRLTYINNKPILEPYVKERSKNDLAPIKVPEGSVFVMGDNRSLDLESSNAGMIPIESISGKVLFSYWPLVSNF